MVKARGGAEWGGEGIQASVMFCQLRKMPSRPARPIIYRLILCLDDGDEKLQKFWQYSDNGSGPRPEKSAKIKKKFVRIYI